LASIDGEPLERVLARLEPLIIADGVGAQPRARLLERDFARLYPLVYGLKPRYRLGLRDAAGAVAEIELDGATRDEAVALRASRRSAPVWGAPARETAQLPFLLNMSNDVMWVRMPSFGSPDQASYAARVEALVEGLGSARALVIDLRGNEGGLRTHGVALLNHVLGAPYTQWRGMSARVRRIPAAHAGRVSGSFGADVRALEGFPAPGADGVSRVEGDPLAARMRPVGAAFEGRVVVLADGLTNSAANELIVALKHARPDVLLVGEEVGGACGEHVGELPILWRAPSHGVVALLSLLRLEHVTVEGCKPGRGLLPDVAVVYTAAAFDSGEDPYVEAVAQVLSKR
jgi:C-terminal processing protease CtpA/Prc